jgi:hypothetical protein
MTEPTIYAALAAVMADVDHVAKRERNTQGRGYDFRGVDAVVNAVGPALRKHKVIVVPNVREYTYGEILSGKDRTPMGHARVIVEYTFYGPDGGSLPCATAGEAFDSGDKATAKAMSVAFRTALLQALSLPTDEPDPDSHSYERSEPAPDPMLAAKKRLWPLTAKHGDDDDRKAWIAAALDARGLSGTAADLDRLAEELERTA